MKNNAKDAKTYAEELFYPSLLCDFWIEGQ